MTILIVSSNFPPALGGPAVTTNYLAESLRKKKKKVLVLTNGIKEKYKDKEFVIRTPYVPFRKNTLLGALLRIWFLTIYLIRFRKKYNIIISQDTNISGIATFLSSFITRKKYIVKFSGDLAVEYLFSKYSLKTIYNNKPFIAKFLHFIQRIICNKSEKVLATSKYNIKILKKMKVNPKKIFFFPNGTIKQKIDKKIIRKIKNKYGNNTISTACRLVKWKNVDFLIRVMKSLPNYKLLIFGDGPERKNLQQLVSNKKIKNVFFFGSIPYNKIQSYIKATRFFALTSEYEPFGIAILDALVVGVPTIVSNVGGMPEVVNGNGVIFKLNNEEDFIKKLRVLENVKVKNINKYTWDYLIDKFLKMILDE